MIAANYTSVRNNLKTYCDMATDNNETIIVTRKAEKNIVILSLTRYNELMKALRNAQYYDKIDRAFLQLRSGGGQVHDLIEE